MAIGFLYSCTCNQRFKVYVPKRKLFAALTGNTVNWKAVDDRDEAEGGVRELMRQAEFVECNFVDTRENETLTCPVCTKQINLVEFFRLVVRNISRTYRGGTKRR